jgi:hypothetical protein
MTLAEATALMLSRTREAMAPRATDHRNSCRCQACREFLLSKKTQRPCSCGSRDCSYCRFDSRGKQVLSTIASPSSLDEQVATVVSILRARRHDCYGAWVGTDAQIDEAARAIVAVLSLNAHNELTDYRKEE